MADETVGLRLDIEQADAPLKAAKNFDVLDKKIRDTAEASHRIDVGMREMAGSGRNVGMAMMQLSQTLDDAQYGIRGIVNNVPLLITSLGFGVGVAGAVQVAMIGINQLTQHMELLDRALGMANADKFLKQMEAIGEKTDKATAKIDPVTGMVKQPYDAIAQAPTPTEAEAAKPLAEAWKQASREQRDAAMRSVTGSYWDEAIGGDKALIQLREKAEQYQKDIVKEQAYRNTVVGGELHDQIARTSSEDRERAARNAYNQAVAQLKSRGESLWGKAGQDAVTLQQRAMAGDPEAMAEFQRRMSSNAAGADLAGTLGTAAGDQEKALQMEAETEAARITAERELRAETEKREEVEKRIAEDMESEVEAARKRGEAEAQALLDDPYQKLKDRRNAGRMQGQDAMRQMQALQLEWLENNDPAGARMMRSQMAANARMNDPNAVGNMAARQAALRMSGGGGSLRGAAERAAKNQQIAEKMQKASMTFEEAVKKLADGNIQVVM